MDELRIEVGSIDDLELWRAARAVRELVFVREQSCPGEEEWDGEDLLARHLVAYQDGIRDPGSGIWGRSLTPPRVVEAGAGIRESAGPAPGVAVGAARWRLVEPGVAKLERFAVLPTARSRGVGRSLVAATLADARAAGCRSFVLHSQLQAQRLYAAFGFAPSGDTFVEAGIDHVRMSLDDDPEVP